MGMCLVSLSLAWFETSATHRYGSFGAPLPNSLTCTSSTSWLLMKARSCALRRYVLLEVVLVLGLNPLCFSNYLVDTVELLCFPPVTA